MFAPFRHAKLCAPAGSPDPAPAKPHGLRFVGHCATSVPSPLRRSAPCPEDSLDFPLDAGRF